jgi:hypothetical protein
MVVWWPLLSFFCFSVFLPFPFCRAHYSFPFFSKTDNQFPKWLRACGICFSCVWLIVLHITTSDSIHVLTSDRVSFPLLLSSITCVNVSYFLYSFIHLRASGMVPYFGIVNSPAINMSVQECFWYNYFISCGYMPSSGIAGSYGSSIRVFENSPCCFP